MSTIYALLPDARSQAVSFGDRVVVGVICQQAKNDGEGVWTSTNNGNGVYTECYIRWKQGTQVS
jgi:hypothetical protein